MWKYLTIPFVLVLALPEPPTPLKNLIEDLNERATATSNIFYLTNSSESFEALLKYGQLPKLIVSTIITYELRNYYSKKLVTIVQLRAQYTQWQQQLSTLVAILQRVQRTDVLFVSATNAARAVRHWLFAWCWQYGLTNTLLTDMTSETLYSYYPFPTVKVFKTTLHAYFAQRNNWQNAQGYRLRACAGNNPPRALVYKAPSGEIIYSALHPTTMKYFAAIYNLTLDFKLMPNYMSYSVFDCLRYVKAGLADICADSIAITKGYLSSRPVSQNPLYVLVRYPQPVAKFEYFIRPFSGGVWRLLAAIVIYIALLLAVVHRQQDGSWNMSYFLLETIASMTFTNAGLRLQLFHGRTKYILYILLVLSGFVVSNLYLALLSSFFSTQTYERELNTLADLQRENVSILVSKFEVNFMIQRGISARALPQLLVRDDATVRKNRNALNTAYAYAVLEDKRDLIFYQQKFLLHPRMKSLEKPFITLLGGNPMVRNWPFQHLFEQFTARIFEAGLKLYLAKSGMEEAIRCGIISFIKMERHEVKPLDMAYFVMPACLLFTGYAAALLCFVLEQILWRRIKRNYRNLPMNW